MSRAKDGENLPLIPDGQCARKPAQSNIGSSPAVESLPCGYEFPPDNREIRLLLVLGKPESGLKY